jgi:DNA polymerase I-like protein with 3'-5' exonuclease and polymerase domains/uracil-DNA glycosylase
MLVGESWSFEDERACEPFQGESGKELNRVLHEAGIMRSELYLTNLVNARAPQGNLLYSISQKKTDQDRIRREMGGDFLRDRVVSRQILEGYARLQREIEAVQPNVIVALGNSVLWALTGAWSLEKWRGSMLKTDAGRKLIPTYASWSIMSQWDKRAIMVHDLKRAREESIFPTYNNEPQWNFIVRPRFQAVIDVLDGLFQRAETLEDANTPEQLWLDFDLETRAGHIACAGVSWSTQDAICIPFMCVEDREGYWSFEEEVQIVDLLRRLLTHPKVAVRWQNGLYDAQYTWRHWHYIPNGRQDTMIAQHTAFVALPKSLAFQSSMYSPHYVYWKDDGATWHLKASEETLWAYNCQDCVRTREVGEAEARIIKQLGLEEVDAFQQRFFYPVLQAMLDGVLVDKRVQRRLDAELVRGIETRQRTLDYLLGLSLNINSSKQMCDVFYNVLQQIPIKTRAKKGVPGHLTCDDEALQLIGKREPILRPIVTLIADIRTMRVLLSTFTRAQTDADGRMRCSFNIGGNAKTEDSGQQAIAEKSAPYTYRLSSSKNAFGGGCNFQNIPSDKSKAIGKAKARGTTFSFPNMRSMYIPDPGHTFFDLDLDRADLQVVVWESEDEVLRAALQLGVDIHLLNVYGIDSQEPPPLEELVETHPKYPDHRGPRKHKREFAKVFCHATNYGGGARTVAAHTGRTVHEIDRAQRAWFAAHPGIKAWHDRTEHQIQHHHFVENRFGYRWHIFDRLDRILPEALAWVPQSTVGCLINRIWLALHDNAPDVQVLIQVHDSLAGQFPTALRTQSLQRINELALIPIPYEIPLIIPIGIKTSEISWGECA